MLDELQARVSVFCLQSGCLQSFVSTGENDQGSFNILWAVLPPGASGKEAWATIWGKEAFLPSSRHVPLFPTFSSGISSHCVILIQTPPPTLLSPSDRAHSSSHICHCPLVWPTDVIHLDDVSGFLSCLIYSSFALIPIWKIFLSDFPISVFLHFHHHPTSEWSEHEHQRKEELGVTLGLTAPEISSIYASLCLLPPWW